MLDRPWRMSLLRGRRQEREAVTALLAGTATGRGGALLFHGDLGIGKTALLRSAIAQADGFAVFAVAAYESESALPFAALDRLLHLMADSVSGPTAEQALALLRATDGGRGDGDRLALFDQVLGLFRRVAQERPLLCCVDDTHWLDRPSLDTFGFVARRLRRDRIAMLLTRCDEDGRAEPVPGIPAHRLGPLDHRASREMLRDLVAVADAADPLACLAMGNPHALTDLARSLTPEQLRGDAPLPQTLPAESALRRAYRTQLQRLPAGARRLVLLAAADEELDVDTLIRAAAAAGLDIAALAPAEVAGLVRVQGRAIGFTRPLVRAVAYHEAPLAERRDVHALLAETLDPQTQPLRHYLHRALASAGPDELLAARLEQAAAGSRGRYAAASRALERSAELTRQPAAAAARLIASARHAWRAGEPYRARMLLRGVRPMGVSAGIQAESRVLQGEIELRVGVPALARDTLLSAAEELAGSDRYRAIDAFMRAGEAMCLSGDYSHYPEVARQALALRRPNEPLAVEFVCEHFATLSATFRGEHRRAADPLRRVLALAPELDDAGVLTQASFAAMLCGAEADAYRLATRGAAVARANRDVSAGPRAMDLVALAEFAMGRYDNPTTALRGLELARSSGQENLVTGQLATLALLAATVGDRATCLRRVRAVKTHLTPQSAGRARAFTTWALALLDLNDGQYADAVARLTAIMANHGDGHLIVQLAATPHLVEAAVRCDTRRPAVAALKVFDAWAGNSANSRWLALSARCHALLAGRDAAADEYFHEALGQHQLNDAEFDRARTELLYGQRLRRQRRRAAAREHLRSALATFERFEARPWIDQTTAELRAAGHQVQPRRVSAVPALTAQQQEIARLVADGATNREIATRLLLSTRTIDHHLRNIFAKLGVRSRVDLARLMS